jgi:CHAT domain-containing protein
MMVRFCAFPSMNGGKICPKLPKDLPRAGEKYYDGKLTASEVLEDWRLDAELVTLSACESGLGRHGGGDGLLGFAQAFLLAGSRSVCLSLWKVDDTATALLMDRFYQNLLGRRPGLDKPMPKAVALAEAKQWLRNLSTSEAAILSADLTKGVARGKGKLGPLLPAVPESKAKDGGKEGRPYAHPTYWAAFVLFGDPD